MGTGDGCRNQEQNPGVRGAVIGNMIIVAPCWKLGAPNISASVPRLDKTTGSIELGIFDEPEKRRTRGSPTRSHVESTRSSWPLSARLLVGALFVVNILLAVFLVRTGIMRPGAPAISTPLRPKADSTPRPIAPPAQGPNQGPDQGVSPSLNAPASEAKPVEARAAHLPGSRIGKRPATKALPKALRASRRSRAVPPAPMPRAVTYPPHEPLVPAPAPARNAAAASSASANVASPGRALSFGNPVAGVPSRNAPAASALAPSAIDHGLAAKGTRPGSGTKVASVGLPAMEKGLVPRKPIASVASNFQIVPHPPVQLENCGDDKVFVACPTLKFRYDTPYTSADPE